MYTMFLRTLLQCLPSACLSRRCSKADVWRCRLMDRGLCHLTIRSKHHWCWCAAQDEGRRVPYAGTLSRGARKVQESRRCMAVAALPQHAVLSDTFLQDRFVGAKPDRDVDPRRYERLDG